MIHFNTLLIEDNKLVYDASVKEASYYDNVYIKAIVVHNQDTYLTNPTKESLLSEPCIFKKEYTTDDFSTKVKEASEELTAATITAGGGNIEKDLFYVYAIATVSGTIGDIPCTEDQREVVLCVLVNNQALLKGSMAYVKEYGEDCAVPNGFIDWILRSKLVEVALKTKNYITANKYWKMMFYDDAVVSSSTTNKCGCHG